MTIHLLQSFYCKIICCWIVFLQWLNHWYFLFYFFFSIIIILLLIISFTCNSSQQWSKRKSSGHIWRLSNVFWRKNFIYWCPLHCLFFIWCFSQCYLVSDCVVLEWRWLLISIIRLFPFLIFSHMKEMIMLIKRCFNMCFSKVNF